MKIIAMIATMILCGQLFSQNLSKQRIWKVTQDKNSIYFDQGIFHSDMATSASVLKNIRNSYVKSRGFERLVFDFEGGEPPKIYGHISMKKKKLYIDFFNTSLAKNFTSIKNVKFVKSVDLFNIDKELLSIEVNVSKKVNYDIFYLKNPARVVIDIKQ